MEKAFRDMHRDRVVPLAGAEGIFNSPDRNQTAIVYDLISEGPIEGLVNNQASIFLNGTPLIDEDIAQKINPTITEKASLSASSNTTTVSVTSSENFFDGLTTADLTTYGERFAWVYGAGKSTTSSGGVTFSMTADSKTLTASGSFFTEAMEEGSQYGRTQIVVEGCGYGGQSIPLAIVEYVNATTVKTRQACRTTISGESGAIIHKSKITAFDSANDTCTITDAAVTTVTNAKLIIQGANPATPNAVKSEYNFDNVGTAFRTGTLNQPIMNNGIASIPQATFSLAANSDIKQTTGYGVGKNSQTNITSSNVDVSDASLVDQIKLTFEFPQGLWSQDRDDGEEGPGWSELQIYFEYKINANDSFTSELMFGRDEIKNSAGVAENVNQFGLEVHGQRSEQASDAFVIAKTKMAFAEEFILDVQKFQPFSDWRVVVKKVNEDNFDTGGDWKFFDTTKLKTVEAMIMDKLSYPLTAYAFTTFNAKDFQNPPQRKYHVKGMKVQVPTNYITRDEDANGVARYERNVTTGADASAAQTWDGNMRGDVSTFTAPDTANNYDRVYTNNPAWVFYDLCTNKRYGLGSIIKEEDLIDKYALYKIARYCDELVPDGKGGTEPRFTCNAYIDKGQEAYTVLMDLARCFRGIVLWMDGKITAVQDSPKTPIYTFSQSNVVDGSFGYQSASARQRANQVVVSWNDPDDNFEQKVEIVEDVESIIEKNEIITKSISAYATTSQGQAHRLGQYMILTERLENETVSFTTGVNGAFIRPGDIVNVQDNERDLIQFSGRVTSMGTLDTNNIYLDRTVNLQSDSVYTLHVIFPSGGAYIASDKAVADGGHYHTIEGVKYFKGDFVPRLRGTTLSTETITSNANIIDDDGDAVTLQWSGETRVENKIINVSASSGTVGTDGSKDSQQINLIEGFSDTPEKDSIWAITSNEASGNESDNKYRTKQYRILSIDEDTEASAYSISASLYDKNKYDLLERGYKIYEEPFERDPGRIEAVPAPTDITVSMRGGTASYGTSNYNATTPNIARLQWKQPLSAKITQSMSDAGLGIYSELNETLTSIDTTITLDSVSDFSSSGIIKIDNEFIKYTGKSSNDLTGCTRGAYNTAPASHVNNSGVRQAIEIYYPDIASYEVKHNFHPDKDSKKGYIIETVPGSQNSLTITNITPGYHKVAIRTISIYDRKSAWVEQDVYLKPVVPNQAGRTDLLLRGGHMTGSFILNESTGNVNTSADNYTFTNIAGKKHTVTSATTAQEIQVFSGLSASNGEGFLAHDSSDTSDPWKAIEIYEDNVAVDNVKGVAGQLNEALNATETNITLDDVSDFPTSGTIVINNEQITYTGKSSNDLTGCTRGANGTTATTHADNSGVYYGFLRARWWKEVGASNKGLTQATGTVTVEQYTNVVTGSSTQFVTDGVQVGDLIRIHPATGYDLATGGVYHRVSKVESETKLLTEEIIPRAFSGKYLSYQSWKPDFQADSLIAKIKRTGNSAYEYVERYAHATNEDSYTVSITNDAKVLPTTSGGTVTYTDSGTTISVFKGTKQLQAVATGTTPSPGEFRVVQGDITDTNITKGSQSISGKTLVFGVASSCTATNALITYPIDIESVLTISKTQTFSKAIQGSDGDPGAAGQGVKYAQLFKLNDSTIGNANAGTFADPANGQESGWTIAVPSLGSTDGNKVYVSTRTFTSDGESPQTSSWTTPVIYARYDVGADGDPGAAGPRAWSGRLYHQAAASSAPTAPTSSNTNTFNFGTGAFGNILSGWATSPAVYASGNSNKYWYIPLTVSEATLNGTQTLTFGSVTQAIGFSGLVTFSGSSLTDGSGSFNTTAISGGAITTGTIDAARISTDLLRIGGNNFAGGITDGTVGGWEINSNNITAGSNTTLFQLDQSNKKIRIGAKQSLTDGNAGVHIGTDGISLGASSVFKVTNAGALTATNATITGVITATSGSFTGAVTATSGTFAGSLSSASGTFTGSLSSASGTFTGALSGGTISIGSSNSIFKADSNGIYLGNATFGSAPFRVTPAGALTATNATITGNITLSNQSSITLSGFNNDSGFQANDADKTDGSVGGWSLSSTALTSAGSSPKITIANESHSGGPYILISD